MGKTVSEVFGAEFFEGIASAEIIGMNIDMEAREVTAKIAPKNTVLPIR